MAVPPDLSAYKSFIEEGQAGYDAPSGQLGMVDPGIRYDPRQHSYASDLYSYYLGGGRGVPSSRGAGDVTPAGIMLHGSWGKTGDALWEHVFPRDVIPPAQT